jgi:hypothetical protein
LNAKEGGFHTLTLRPTTRQVFILLALSLVSFVVALWQLGFSVVFGPTAFFGFMSVLPVPYWIGMGLLAYCVAAAFLSEVAYRDSVFIAILLTVGVFLFGLPVFVEGAARTIGAYYPSSEVQILTQTGHLPAAVYPLSAYIAWPAIHFISAALIEITGGSFWGLLGIWPIVWLFIIVSFAYSFSRRFGFVRQRAFGFTFMVLVSYWIDWNNLSPEGLSMLLYFLCFVMIVSYGDTPTKSLLLMLVFAALTLTHGYTSFAALLGIGAVLLIRKKSYTVALTMFIIAIVWIAYDASSAPSIVWAVLLTNPLGGLTQSIQQLSAVGHQIAFARSVDGDLKLAYGVILAGAASWSALSIIRRKLDVRVAKDAGVVLIWLLGIGLATIPIVASSVSVSDTVFRLYLYALIPIAYLAMRSIKSKTVLLVLVLFMFAAFVPTKYNTEALTQVLPSELAGSHLFALGYQSGPYYLFGVDEEKSVLLFAPDLITVPAWSPARVNFSVGALRASRYVLLSEMGEAQVIWTSGFEYYNNVVNVISNIGFNRVYDNQYYSQFENPFYSGH